MKKNQEKIDYQFNSIKIDGVYANGGWSNLKEAYVYDNGQMRLWLTIAFTPDYKNQDLNNQIPPYRGPEFLEAAKYVAENIMFYNGNIYDDQNLLGWHNNGQDPGEYGHDYATVTNSTSDPSKPSVDLYLTVPLNFNGGLPSQMVRIYSRFKDINSNIIEVSGFPVSVSIMKISVDKDSFVIVDLQKCMDDVLHPFNPNYKEITSDVEENEERKWWKECTLRVLRFKSESINRLIRVDHSQWRELFNNTNNDNYKYVHHMIMRDLAVSHKGASYLVRQNDAGNKIAPLMKTRDLAFYDRNNNEVNPVTSQCMTEHKRTQQSVFMDPYIYFDIQSANYAMDRGIALFLFDERNLMVEEAYIRDTHGLNCEWRPYYSRKTDYIIAVDYFGNKIKLTFNWDFGGNYMHDWDISAAELLR